VILSSKLYFLVISFNRCKQRCIETKREERERERERKKYINVISFKYF